MNKDIEKWEKCGLLNIFKDKGFNDEDREDWYRFWNKVDIRKNKEMTVFIIEESWKNPGSL